MSNLSRVALGIGALVFLTSAHAESLLTNHGKVVAVTDADAPGTPLFTTFGSSLDLPAMADDGSVLFRSNLLGASIGLENSRALFMGPTFDALSLLTRWA